MNAVFFRTLVTEFYRQNSGFFLLILLIGFGIIRSDDHVALFRYAMVSPSTLVYYVIPWMLYGLKTLSFVRSQFRHPAYGFLDLWRLIPFGTRLSGWVTMQAGLLLPVFLYAGWMGVYAFPARQWSALVLIGLVLLGLVVLPIPLLERMLHQTSREVRVRTFIRHWPLPYPLYFIQHLFRRQPLLLLLTKIFSGLLIMGVCLLYPTDDYDERLLTIGMLIGGLTQLGLAQEQYVFEHEYLLFLRNLPLSFGKRIGYLFVQGLLLFIPETLLLFRYLPATVSWLYVGKALFFGIGLWLAGLHRLYQNDKSLENLGSYGLWGFPIGLLLIMFQVDTALLGLLLWAYAGWVNTYHYYRSEFHLPQ